MPVKVYVIRNTTSNSIYIGSTLLHLEKRLYHHRQNLLKCRSHILLQCPTATIELLEECSADMRKERERWWIENTPNCVNRNRPGRTVEDRRKQSREATARYRASGKEVITENQRQRHLARGKETYAENRLDPEWVEKRREQKRQAQARYREKLKPESSSGTPLL